MRGRWFIDAFGGIVATIPSTRMVIVAALIALLVSTTSAFAEPLPRSVLLIDQENQSRVWNFDLSNALRSVLTAEPGQPILVYADNLDLARFSGSQYEEAQRHLFREKYRGVPVGVIVVNGTRALDFALSLRPELWPNVPIVFAAVNDETAERMKSVPNVTGHIMRLTLRDMVAAARLFVPNLKRLAIVGDRFERNTFFRGFLQEFSTFATELEFIDLTGLPMNEIKSRVAALPDDAAIGYTTLTVDGAGVDYLPREAIAQVAEVANRPIVTNTENFINYGAGGGFVVSAGPIGDRAGRYALRLLDGEAASSIPVLVGDFNKPVFDWRALKRWGVSEARLPPGSDIRFRSLTAWEQYRWQIVFIIAALLIQMGLIVGLFFERRRRRHAEITSRSAMAKLAQMNRVATAGELSASIAHEVNQPLTAIVNFAGAGLRWLERPAPDLDEVRTSLQDIVNQGHRASEVIGNVRAMFNKDNEARAPLAINELVLEVLRFVRVELRTQGITVQTELGMQLPLLPANKGQLQQVILNLVRNAADAMNSTSDRPRVLRVKTTLHDPDSVLVSIEDSGTGIDPKDIERIFESFFTTKSDGMGMGLSICRSIIEAHKGRLWASTYMGRGSVLNVQLPAAEAGVE